MLIHPFSFPLKKARVASWKSALTLSPPEVFLQCLFPFLLTSVCLVFNTGGILHVLKAFGLWHFILVPEGVHALKHGVLWGSFVQ